jgi:S-adenosylmethionine-dependent methyltransferase
VPDPRTPSESGQGRRPRRGDVTTAPRSAAVWELVRDTATRLQADQPDTPLRVLDVGGGTGGLAVQLAALGHDVTVADSSPDALAALERRAAEFGVVDRVRAVQADAGQLGDVVPDASIDLVCCHGVLEYVDDPLLALRVLAATLRPGGVASLLVAQRSAVVLARALAGRFTDAARALDDPDGRWGPADPLPRRFDEPVVRALVADAGLGQVRVHGVRLFSDLVPDALVDGDDARTALLDLERRAGAHPDHPELVALATQLHVLAVRT